MPSEEPSNHERFASLAQRLRVFQPSPFPGPARAGAITEAEAELGVTFPISYRLFLEQFSGGGFPFQIYGVEPETEPAGRQWYFDHVVGMTLSERQEVEIDEHHPSWSTMEVYGVARSLLPVKTLQEFGVTGFEDRTDGFVASRT